MLRKKRKARHTLPQVEVNIVSLMDILTTLLFFILLVASISKFSVLDAFSMMSGAESESNKNKFALQITMNSEKSAVMRLGSLKDLKMVDEKNMRSIVRRYFKGNEKEGYERKYWGRSHDHLIQKMQSTLVEIKKSFPHEHKLVLAMADNVPYQKVIDTMAGLRTLGPKDKPFRYTTLVGNVERTKVLFPQVIITEKGKN